VVAVFFESLEEAVFSRKLSTTRKIVYRTQRCLDAKINIEHGKLEKNENFGSKLLFN
jgi:hypothetical protein